MTDKIKENSSMLSQSDIVPNRYQEDVWKLKLIVAKLFQFLIPCFKNFTIKEISNDFLGNSVLLDDYLLETKDPVTEEPIEIEIIHHKIVIPDEVSTDNYFMVFKMELLKMYIKRSFFSSKKLYSIWIIDDGFDKNFENTTIVQRPKIEDIDSEGNRKPVDDCPFEIFLTFLSNNPPEYSVFEYINAVFDYNEEILDKYLEWDKNDSDKTTRKEMSKMFDYHQIRVDKAREETKTKVTTSHINSMRRKGLSDEEIANLLDLELSVVRDTPIEHQ